MKILSLGLVLQFKISMNYSLPGSLLKMFLTSASSPVEEAWCNLNGFTLSLSFSCTRKIQINCTHFL